MNAKKSLLEISLGIQMASDPRLPRNAVGYVADLPGASLHVLTDRLRMLSRWIPDLVEEYRRKVV